MRVETERTSKYWICSECASKKAWFLPYANGVTGIFGLCGWCDNEDEIALVPVIDFSGPGKKAIWD